MGKCYCDYCDVFLTNDSVAVRKQHNEGNRHKYNVCEYYRQYIGQQLQKQIDHIVQQFEIKVASGLVRPTYGLPPAVKAHMVLQKAQPAASDADGSYAPSDEPVQQPHAQLPQQSAPQQQQQQQQQHPSAPQATAASQRVIPTE